MMRVTRRRWLPPTLHFPKVGCRDAWTLQTKEARLEDLKRAHRLAAGEVARITKKKGMCAALRAMEFRRDLLARVIVTFQRYLIMHPEHVFGDVGPLIEPPVGWQTSQTMSRGHPPAKAKKRGTPRASRTPTDERK